MIILTEENITPKLIEKAFNCKCGFNYDSNSEKVRKMIKQHTANILNKIRKTTP